MSQTPLTIATPVTKLFGIRMPVIAGGLMWLSNAEYVAAAGRAGIIGFITAASFPDNSELRAEILRCRKLSEGAPFGVNVSMLPELVHGEKIGDVFQLIVDEGVRFIETSGRSPEEYMPMLKRAGVKVMHKVPSVRYAVKAESIGVDLVAIVGTESGGHLGMDLVGTFANAALAASQLKVPYVIGGGVGHGSQLIAAMAMGASGVVVGTRFVVADEIWAHRNYKHRFINAQPTEIEISMESIRNTVQSLHNETTAAVHARAASNPDISIQELLPLVSATTCRDAHLTGDWRKGVLAAGHSLAFADKVEPLASILSQFESDVRSAMARLPKSIFERDRKARVAISHLSPSLT